MQSMLNSIKYAYVVYSAIGISMVLIWIAIIYLYIQEANKQKRNLLYLVGILLFLILNPFTANNIMSFVVWGIGYWMVFMIIPSAVFVAYGMTKVIITQQEEKKQWILAGGCIIILLVSINFTFSLENIKLPDNKYKISEEAMELQQILSGFGSVYVIAPREIEEQLREYDTSIRVMGGDSDKWNVLTDISSNWSDTDKLVNYAMTYGCNCIVYPKDDEVRLTMGDGKFALSADTENYYIYLYQYLD